MYGLGRDRTALDNKRWNRVQPYGRSRHGRFAGTPEFVQISDSHMGFNTAANTDVAATLQQAVAKINALPAPPLFVIHTGDISHLSKPSEFDTVDQILKSIRTSQIFFVPGEHDGLGDTESYTSNDTEKEQMVSAGTASIKKACTSSGWSTSLI